MSVHGAAERALWVDGVLGAGVPADDPGLLLGLTVFETLRTYAGVPFRLDEHLDRLLHSAEAMAIAAPEKEELARQILAVSQRDVSIRYTITGGGRCIIQRTPLDASRVGRAMRVAQMTWVNPTSLPGAVKHGCRAAWILAAQQRQVDEVLLVDSDGFILEANRSNVFAVLDGVLCTPPLDGRQLAGVTRGALMDAASDAGIAIEERPLPVDAKFQEFYLASTLKELAPVFEIDGRKLHGAGPVGLELHQSFQALVRRETTVAIEN